MIAVHSLRMLSISLLAATTLVAGMASAQPSPVRKVLRHVVLFKFKEGTTAEQIKQLEDAFRALPSKMDLIRGFEWGTNVSPENLAQAF